VGGMLRCRFEQMIAPYDCDHNHMVQSFAFGMFESAFERLFSNVDQQYHMILSNDRASYDNII
jgi:hypothetical protein